MNKQLGRTLFLVVLGCCAMAVTDGLWKPGYLGKSLVKIVFFLILPLCLGGGKKTWQSLVRPSRKGLGIALALGAGVYAVILAGYFGVSAFYDFSAITALLGQNAGVNRENFLWVSLYIAFCNSLLEELFFRGFAFRGTLPSLGRAGAYAFSAGSFALYHVAIMTGWFSWWLFLLVMAGLFLGGCIFNRLDETDGSIFPSWMVHMFANFAINTVGLLLFYG